MGQPVRDKVGQRYGKLTVLRLLPRNMYEPVLFACACDCGNESVVNTKYLHPDGTASCGCAVTEASKARWRRDQKPLAGRFWKYVRKSDRCWEWIGAIDPQTGYGRIGRGGRDGGIASAHRVSYELHFGPVPSGLLVCHHCDNRKCVRPDHLYAGTYSDNRRDAVERSGNRQARGAVGHG